MLWPAICSGDSKDYWQQQDPSGGAASKEDPGCRFGPGTGEALGGLQSVGPPTLLLGGVKWSHRVDWGREEATLHRKADNLPLARGNRAVLGLLEDESCVLTDV